MYNLDLDIFDIITLLLSWYIKPLILNETLFFNLQFIIIYTFILLTTLTYTTIINLYITILNFITSIKFTSFLSIFMGLKFIVLIGLLIVVRGGIPRYRYDFLTKLG
jgi:NADH:ubiquinone oxidoreductase subunit H